MDGGNIAIGAATLIGSTLFVVILIGAIVGLIWLKVRGHVGALKTMAAMPVTPVAQVQEGALVKIHGAVRVAEERLTDPLLREGGVAYSVLVEQNKQKHAAMTEQSHVSG